MVKEKMKQNQQTISFYEITLNAVIYRILTGNEWIIAMAMMTMTIYDDGGNNTIQRYIENI